MRLQLFIWTAKASDILCGRSTRVYVFQKQDTRSYYYPRSGGNHAPTTFVVFESALSKQSDHHFETFGAAMFLDSCCGEGFLTFDNLPSSTILRCASNQSGSSVESWFQCATAASSHQSSSFGIARRCAPASINPRIDASSSQADNVQKVIFASRRPVELICPRDRRACRRLRIVSHRKYGTNRIERMRNRVTDMNAIPTALVVLMNSTTARRCSVPPSAT
jgi:hypothetical protein